MKFSEMLHNPHFVNLAAIMRVAQRSMRWRQDHPQVPVWTRVNDLAAATRSEKFDQDRHAFVTALSAYLVELRTADEKLSYNEDDLRWVVEMLDTEDGSVLSSLLLAAASAPDEHVTPAEVAAATGTAESGWRNKAAAGEIPGAAKKGKQWLLPVSVVRSQLPAELAGKLHGADPDEDC